MSGPLSLQVGQVTSAVDDLISGYENIVESLPMVADKVSKMHSGTKILAEELESKMSNLVDGYGYLQSIAVEMPQSIRDLALENRKNLLLAIKDSTPSPIDQNFLDHHTRQLDDLRQELQSITQERIIQNVQTRNLLASSVKPKDRLSHLSLLRNKDLHPETTLPSDKTVSSAKSKLSYQDPHASVPIPVYKPSKVYHTSENHPNENILRNITPRYIARAVGTKIIVPNVRTGSLPEELENLQTTPVDMPLTEKRVIKKSHFKRIMKNKFQKTQADVANLRETLAETSKRLNDDQEKARIELKKMLLNLQKDIHTHDDTVAKVLGKVIEETMHRVDDMTESEARKGLERVMKVSNTQQQQKQRKKSSHVIKIDSSTNDSKDEMMGYKTMIVGGKGKSFISPSLQQLSDNHSSGVQFPTSSSEITNTRRHSSPVTEMKSSSTTHEESSQTVKATNRETKQKIEIKPSVDEQTFDNIEKHSPILYSSRLIGDKDHGVRWERVPNDEVDIGDDEYENEYDGNDQYSLPGIPSRSNKGYLKYFNPLTKSTDIQNFGGGETIVIQDRMIESDLSLDEDVDHSIPRPRKIFGDYHEPIPQEATIAGQQFLDKKLTSSRLQTLPNQQATSTKHLTNEALFPILSNNYQVDEANLISGVSSYWLSRVLPLKMVTKEQEQPPVIPISLPPQQVENVKSSRLDQDLLQVIQSMMTSQQSSAAGTQAVMLTLIEAHHQERLMAVESAAIVAQSQQEQLQTQLAFEAEQREQIARKLEESKQLEPVTPSAGDIAVALADAIKDMISSTVNTLIAAQPPPMPQPIIINPSPIILPSPSPQTTTTTTTVVVKDESIQVTSQSLDSMELTSTKRGLNKDDIANIEAAVQDGIINGVRDILDIICPNESDIEDLDDRDMLDDDERGWNTKNSIRKHITALDKLERVARSQRRNIVPSTDEIGMIELPEGLLVIDREKRIEATIEKEMIESKKRLNLLSIRRREDDLEDDNNVQYENIRIYRETAEVDIDESRPMKTNRYRKVQVNTHHNDLEDDNHSVTSSTSSIRQKYSKLQKGNKLSSAIKRYKPVKSLGFQNIENDIKDSVSDDNENDNDDNLFSNMGKYPTAHENRKDSISRREDTGFPLLYSHVVPHDATRAMMSIDELSIYGSENDYIMSTNIISGLPHASDEELRKSILENENDFGSQLMVDSSDSRMSDKDILHMTYSSSSNSSSSDIIYSSNDSASYISNKARLEVPKKRYTNSSFKVTRTENDLMNSMSIHESIDSVSSRNVSDFDDNDHNHNHDIHYDNESDTPSLSSSSNSQDMASISHAMIDMSRKGTLVSSRVNDHDDPSLDPIQKSITTSRTNLLKLRNNSNNSQQNIASDDFDNHLNQDHSRRVPVRLWRPTSYSGKR